MRNPVYYLYPLLFLLSLAGCGPSRHAVHVEMRHISKSGIELSGKIISVAYSSTGEKMSDMFSEEMASAFAESLEKDYGTGEGSVTLFCTDSRKGNYSQRDSLVSILMSTGSDLVFLFAPCQIRKNSKAAYPMVVTLYCYDGMNKDDKVYAFTGSTIVSSSDQDTLADEASEAGKRVAESFISQWQHEQYSIAYFNSRQWYDALVKAEQYDWKGAMDIWMSLLNTNDLMRRASAEYNMAVACYMLGDLTLAEQWLDKSVSDNDMPTLTQALRKRIESRK